MLVSEGRFPILGNSPVKRLPSESSGPRPALCSGEAVPGRARWPGIAAPCGSAGALSVAGRSGQRGRIRPARRPGRGTRTAAPGAAPPGPGHTCRGRSAGTCPTRGHRIAPFSLCPAGVTAPHLPQPGGTSLGVRPICLLLLMPPRASPAEAAAAL